MKNLLKSFQDFSGLKTHLKVNGDIFVSTKGFFVLCQMKEKVVAERLFQNKNALYNDSIAQPFKATTVGEFFHVKHK